MGTIDDLPNPMEDPFHQIIVESNKDQEDTSDLEGPLESLIKAPTQNIPEVSLSTKTGFTALNAKEFGHMQKDCP